jgi:hypothetical protein
MYRPAPDELAQLFPAGPMLNGEIVDVGESYRGQVKRRPWILLRHILRFPFPFIGSKDGNGRLGKLYWLAHNYAITGPCFRFRSCVEPASRLPLSLTGGSMGFSTRPRLEVLSDRGRSPALLRPLKAPDENLGEVLRLGPTIRSCSIRARSSPRSTAPT